MTTVPNITRSVAAKLAVRIRMCSAIHAASLGFVIGAGLIAIALPISTRLPDIHDRAHWFGAAIIAAGALIGGAWGWRRSVSLSTGAGRADELLGLEDRLTSAIELGQDRSAQSPFAEIAIAEAEERAAGVRASRVVALPLGRRWLVGLLLAGVGFAGWAYIPVRTIEPEARLAQQSPEARAAASDAIAETIEQLEPEGPAKTDLASGLTDELEDIRERLARGEIDADDALAKAAEELEAAASKSEQETENPAQDRIAEAARNSQVGEESAELADALADGDLERARDAAQELLENAGSMPPEARERIARDLESLADALDETSATDEETPDDALTEALRDRLDDLTDTDAVANELEQEGLDPEAARDIAERVAEQERGRNTEQRAREDTERLRDALDAASRDLDESPPPPPSPRPDERTNEQQEEPADNTPSPKNDASENEPDKAEPDEPNARDPQEENRDESENPDKQPSNDQENSTGEQQQKSSDKNQGEPDQQSEPSPDKDGPQDPQGTPSDQPDDQSDTQAGDQPAQDQSGQEQERPDPDATKPRGEQPEQQPGDETEPGAEPGSDPEQTETEQQQPGQEDPAGESEGPSDTKKDGEQSGESSSQGEPDPDGAKPGKGEGEPTDGGESGSGADRLRRELDRLSEGQQAERDGKQRARELRRRAQDLLDEASPEEREDLKKLAERLADEDKNRPVSNRPRSPFDSTSETMDARDPDRTKNRDSERTVSEWFNPDGEAPEGIGKGGRSPQQLRDAVQSAERAVEQQRVPPRYRKLVRDVFKRMRDRAHSEGAAPAKQGEDADAGKGGKAGSDDG